MLLPLDTHAHIQLKVHPDDIAGLDACIWAVTNEPTEWAGALRRPDLLAMWGVGAHPASSTALAAFDEEAFVSAIQQASFVGEVGLDGVARVDRAQQRNVFAAVLRTVAQTPRPVTIHSRHAAADVLASLRACPIDAPILHWWRGSQKETAEAVEMGCYFSVNGAEAARPKVLDFLPQDRVLTETDFPNTRSNDKQCTRPGAVSTIERALADRWSLDLHGVRQRIWRTFAEIADRCDIADDLPEAVQDQMLIAG
jgi:TatD DNase family protein